MKHRFKVTCYDSNKLLEGVNTLSKFMRKLIDQSALHPDRWDPETYKGDGFEALVEVLINSSPIDKRINITDYEPVTSSDYGIDGAGKTHSGKPHTIQVKFRSNVYKSLTANQDHISNFVAKSVIDYGNEVEMTIFTTAKDLNRAVSESMYGDRVRTIGYKELSNLIDKNESFWNIFRKEMN